MIRRATILGGLVLACGLFLACTADLPGRPPGDGPTPDRGGPDGRAADQGLVSDLAAADRPQTPRPDGSGSDQRPPDQRTADLALAPDTGQPCTHQCPSPGQKGCQGNAVVTCGQYDTDPCREWGAAKPCGSWTCQAGACVCQPSCAGKSCGDDGCGGSCGTCPATKSTCSGTTLSRTDYRCEAGTCRARTTSGPCPYGCNGVNCASPPAGSGGLINVLWRHWGGAATDHLTTSSSTERPAGYTFEGQTFYVPATAGSGRRPLYRHYSGAATDHMDSVSASEGASVGYALEGRTAYLYTSQLTGTAEVRRWASGSFGDHMLAFSGENAAPQGYVKEHVLGYGYPRRGNTLTSLVSATGGGVTVKANLVAGGAVWELSYAGKQMINDYDFGRQVQIAFNLVNKAEVDNPTEAGSKFTSPAMGAVGYRQGSPVLSYSASGSTLTTATRPLQWNPSLHGGGQGNPVLWDGFIGKRLDLGFDGLQGVIRWTTLVHFPAAESYLDAEVVTAYLTGDFTGFWAYDATSGTLRDMAARVPAGACLDPSKAPAELQPKAGGVIIATPNKQHALGVYRRHGQRNFGLCKFLGGSTGQYDFATTKWNLLERHGSGVSAGTRLWTAYLVVGTLSQCTQAMDTLYARGH